MVLLHGVGSSAQAMLDLARSFSNASSGLAIVVPDAVDPFDGASSGRQWFSVHKITEENRIERITTALPQVREIIELEAARVGLPPKKIILCGFSQGAILALHLLSDGFEAAGMIGFSGRLAGPVAERSKWPFIHMIHGTHDAVIPLQAVRDSATWLKQAGCQAELTEIDGLGHQINSQTIAIAQKSLVRIFNSEVEVSHAASA